MFPPSNANPRLNIKLTSDALNNREVPVCDKTSVCKSATELPNKILRQFIGGSQLTEHTKLIVIG